MSSNRRANAARNRRERNGQLTRNELKKKYGAFGSFREDPEENRQYQLDSGALKSKLQGDPKTTAIGIGMWLGIIMAYNVWFVIWPNQKKALGIIECAPEEKVNSAKTAMLFSRANTLLSFPMLLSMVAAQNLY